MSSKRVKRVEGNGKNTRNSGGTHAEKSRRKKRNLEKKKAGGGREKSTSSYGQDGRGTTRLRAHPVRAFQPGRNSSDPAFCLRIRAKAGAPFARKWAGSGAARTILVRARSSTDTCSRPAGHAARTRTRPSRSHRPCLAFCPFRPFRAFRARFVPFWSGTLAIHPVAPKPSNPGCAWLRSRGRQ
ncbi:hypothetical protein BOTBODRAFT_430599 [Botryobasidium botryosum FD-172 SS1]|uniref:Uncharacterized protein n=1 Tax=Botryobasidium botryosum (strain FD-172 SS1) TaxID=930990 RepID=A0A067M916_BOTB1|nr:hypothetical protein BOTBODRAFT_430599 [Botryobasidium botryosum FD-172 SS1]